MAIRPTGAMFKSLTFGGVDSADYGIYISGDGVYNSPSRAVEMVSVPGRNGDIPIDAGHWENIEVEYTCGTFAQTQEEFRANFSAFRNAIASQIGYQRLSDSYHPDEYREALFIEGIEVDPSHYSSAGEFSLVFNCKPQRFLTDGETSITVENGDIVTNPTQYDSQPLLEVEGYGNIGFNGFSVDVDQGLFGSIGIAENEVLESINMSDTEQKTWAYPLDTSQANNGDTLSLNLGIEFAINAREGRKFSAVSETTAPANGVANIRQTNSMVSINITNILFDMVVGTSYAEVTYTPKYLITYTYAGNTYTLSISPTIKVAKMAGNILRIRAYITWSGGASEQPIMSQSVYCMPTIISAIEDSTKSYLGTPTYIDCELGDAYKIDGGEYVLLNKYIALGSALPTLSPGANEFAIDDTITDLQIVPRWWKL